MNERIKLQRQHSAERDAISPGQHVSPLSAVVNRSLQTGGQSLEHGTRAVMEQRFGHDFSQVRVHADAQAAESAKMLRAHAWTAGQDIVFGAGYYAPETEAGDRLLVHELTHVVQQAAGPVAGNSVADDVTISHPDDPFEQAAQRMAASISWEGEHRSTTPTMSEVGSVHAHTTPAGSGVAVQRDGDDDPPQPWFPFPAPSPLAPLNLGLLPGDPLGGGIGYGAPLQPLLPELDLDPRAGFSRPSPLDPSPDASSDHAETNSSWGIGLQGRYGEDEKSIAAGLRFNF